MGRILAVMAWALALGVGAPARAEGGGWADAYRAGSEALREGRPAEARRHLEAALAEARAGGPADGRWLSTALALARATREQRAWADGERVVREALAAHEALGEATPGVRVLLNELGVLRTAAGDPAGAEAPLKRALALHEAAGEAGDGAAARVVTNLAEVYRKTRRPAEAVALLERAVAAKEKAHGKDDPALVSTLNDLGLACVDLRRFDEAEAALARALALARAGGGDGATVGTVLHNTAHLEYARGKYDKAAEGFRSAVELREKLTSRAGRADLASSLNALGNSLTMLGRWDDAAAALERALAVKREVFGPRHRAVARTLGDYALMLHRAGRTEEEARVRAELQAMR